MIEQVLTLKFLDHQPERLDLFLVQAMPGFSRARLQSFIRQGLVLVNGGLVKKTGQMLDFDTTIEVHVPAPVPSRLVPEEIPREIVFENEDLLVINTPAGMVVHPAAGHGSGTMVHAVLGHVPDIEGVGGVERPGVVHRLDKETSGLILFAKNDHAHQWLQDQFRLRNVDKTYLALVDGKPPTPSGRVEAAIGRDPAHRKKMAIVSEAKGRQAISEYKTLESFPEHTLLEFHPLTGRTHQVRLHCAFLGCPIVGDMVYGRKKPSLPIQRHFLHAAKLKITLPGENQPRLFEAALPDPLSQVLAAIRKGS